MSDYSEFRRPMPIPHRAEDGTMAPWHMTAARPLGLACWLAATAVLPAQGPVVGPGATRPPAFSPYLNLLRRDNSPAINYSGIVRPQINFREGIQDLEQQQSYLGLQQQADRAAATTGPNVLPPTGHATGFLTHRKYFLTKSAAGAGYSG